jgi:hypothetical protein
MGRAVHVRRDAWRPVKFFFPLCFCESVSGLRHVAQVLSISRFDCGVQQLFEFVKPTICGLDATQKRCSSIQSTLQAPYRALSCDPCSTWSSASIRIPSCTHWVCSSAPLGCRNAYIPICRSNSRGVSIMTNPNRARGGFVNGGPPRSGGKAVSPNHKHPTRQTNGIQATPLVGRGAAHGPRGGIPLRGAFAPLSREMGSRGRPPSRGFRGGGRGSYASPSPS